MGVIADLVSHLSDIKNPTPRISIQQNGSTATGNIDFAGGVDLRVENLKPQ